MDQTKPPVKGQSVWFLMDTICLNGWNLVNYSKVHGIVEEISEWEYKDEKRKSYVLVSDNFPVRECNSEDRTVNWYYEEKEADYKLRTLKLYKLLNCAIAVIDFTVRLLLLMGIVYLLSLGLCAIFPSLSLIAGIIAVVISLYVLARLETWMEPPLRLIPFYMILPVYILLPEFLWWHLSGFDWIPFTTSQCFVPPEDFLKRDALKEKK